MSRYVLVDVGCRECYQGTAVLVASDDLEEIKTAWTAYWAEGARPSEWGVREDIDSYESDWPSNIVSASVWGSGALVAYDMTLPIEPRSNR